ncbi:MAG TPA: hypothetical protein VLJ68_10245 [Chitinophagaceae bacterium]|nr:hypothetical protein [Chitinophagaceae bacterium]
MKDRPFQNFYRKLRPYLFIAVTGILAFAPVSFMLRSLKNDVVALEYPINQFMSQCIHHGQPPYWFNTWALGFPLQSNLTWGIFSTPQLFFSSIFNYDIHSLHIEFVFFVLLAGWGMYYLLKRFFCKDERLALLLSCCYMLSGFMAGSGQWMLYVTAAAFIPIVLASLLQLLQKPSGKHAVLFAILYFFMFTSVYAGFNIISTYCLIIFTICYVWSRRQEKNKALYKWLGLGCFLAVLFCLPCLYYTIEVLDHISRGNPVAGKEYFFNSNYVPAGGLGSLLFPFSSVKETYLNTEGTMYDSYMGLFTLIILPLAFRFAWKEKNRLAWGLLFVSLFFLLTAMGDQLPIRKALNLLPGFSYFRNPGIFRLYFIFLMMLFMGAALKNVSMKTLLDNKASKYMKYSLCIAGAICVGLLFTNVPALRSLSFASLGEAIRQMDHSKALVTGAVIQLLFIFIFFFVVVSKRWFWLKWTVAADLIVNMLICSPYFIISDYTPNEVNSILKNVNGFPVQSGIVKEIPATFTDSRGNHWNNINVFQKQVSSKPSYRGPLELRNYSIFADSTEVNPLVFSLPLITGFTDSTEVKLTVQKPTRVDAEVKTNRMGFISCMQNYFPGWQVYYNNKKIDLNVAGHPGMFVYIPAENGIVSFRYEKKLAWILALILHFFSTGFLCWCFLIMIKNQLRSLPNSHG